MEELKIIIGLIQGLGETSLYAFVIYMVKEVLVAMMVAGTIFGGLFIVIQCIKHCSDDSQTWYALRDLLEIQEYEMNAIKSKVLKKIGSMLRPKD